MAQFSQTSKQRLNTCHIDLQTLFNEVIKIYDCTIVCGHRGKVEQDDAYTKKLSTKKYPNSKHNKIPSEAVDAAPYEKGGIDWKPRQMAFFAGVVKGIAEELYISKRITHKIRLGIDWDSDMDVDDETFIDAPHFEIIHNINEV